MTSEVALQAAADLAVGAALGASSLGVGACFGVVDHAGDDGHVQGAVEASITSLVKEVAHGVPEEAGMGLTPASASKAASDRSRP